jgi:hypothetical protein
MKRQVFEARNKKVILKAVGQVPTLFQMQTATENMSSQKTKEKKKKK